MFSKSFIQNLAPPPPHRKDPGLPQRPATETPQWHTLQQGKGPHGPRHAQRRLKKRSFGHSPVARPRYPTNPFCIDFEWLR